MPGGDGRTAEAGGLVGRPAWPRLLGNTGVEIRRRVGLRRIDWAALGLLAVSVCLLIGPVLYRMIYQPGQSNYEPHLQWTREMAETGRLLISYPLFHFLVILVRAASPAISYFKAGFAVGLGFHLLLGGSLFAFIYAGLGRPASRRAALAYVALTLALMLVSPVAVIWWPRPRLYYGFIAISVYHSPTVTALKPLALLLFWNALQVVRPGSKPATWRAVLASAGLLSLTTLAKPNYTICLLPALCLLALYRYYRKQPVDWPLLLFAFVVPGLAVLAWQSRLTFGPDPAGGIIFAPLQVFLYNISWQWILPYFVLSTLFPLTIYLLYFKRARENLVLNVAWLVFGVADFYNYCLAEAGPRLTHNNFGWGSQVALFIVFVVSAVFFIQQERERPPAAGARPARFWLGWAVFGAHLLCGVIFYYSQVIGPTAVWF